MNDSLTNSIAVASSGLTAQSMRIRVAAENLANGQTTSAEPGGPLYTRKTISFEAELDRVSGASFAHVRDIGLDPAPPRLVHDPGHPAADSQGNVLYPNVDMLVEAADLREANRSYQANVQVVKQTRDLIGMSLDLLKS